MLQQQTVERLIAMKLPGMAEALRDWLARPRDPTLPAADLVGLLADAEWISRENKKLTGRLRQASFKQTTASVEDVDYRYARGLQKAKLTELSSSRWVESHQNIIITGPTGIGKSYLACALGNKACRDGYVVIYRRVTRLFDELAQARGDGTHHLLLRRLAKANLLILDDFGLQPLVAEERKELIEVLEDRYGVSSTIVTSQVDPAGWHAVIGDATLADSICDRLVHNAHRLRLTGESMRKIMSTTSEEIAKGKVKSE